MTRNKKIIITIIVAIIVVLAWAPWLNNQGLHDKVFEKRAEIDGTIDKYTGELICDYNVMWAPFGRWVASCEGGYYVTFWGKILAPEPFEPSVIREDWQPMVEKISVWQNDKEEIVAPENSAYLPMGNILIPTLHKLNLQARCVFSEERIQEIKRNNKAIELVFKQADDFPISQWVQEEERYDIPTDENGYRILENLKSTIFVLEDNLDEGMGGHILVASERKDRDERCSWKVTEADKEKYPDLGSIWSMIAGFEFDEERGCIPVGGFKYVEDVVPFRTEEECQFTCGRMWGCWTIRQKDSNELDKSWIEELNELISSTEL